MSLTNSVKAHIFQIFSFTKIGQGENFFYFTHLLYVVIIVVKNNLLM